MRFEVWGHNFWIWAESEVRGLGLTIRVLRSRIWDLGSEVEDLESGVRDLRLRTLESGGPVSNRSITRS